MFNEYKKNSRGNWGKDLAIWKMMFTAVLNSQKDIELTPFNEMLLKIFSSIPKARKQGKPIIMHPFNYEPELFFAMDLTPLMQEIISVGLAPIRMNQPYIDFANKVGYGDNPTLCNAQRPIISLLMQGSAPLPDLLFYLSTPCNSLSMSYQVYQNLTGISSFNLDIPYWGYNQENQFYDEKTVGYVIDQSKSCIKWIEDNTNLTFNEEKFQQTMQLCNQARGYVLEFNELLQAVPCPVTSETGFANFLTMVTCGGTLDALKVTKSMRDTAADNVKNGIGGVPDEKIRIAWPYTHVFFDPTLLTWIENTFNAVVIMDLLGHYKVLPHDTSTIENCFQSLAKGTLDASMVGKCRGPIEYYIEYMINFIKDYKIDCVIMPMHFACKHVYLMGQVTSEAIKEETGIPSLIFSCDSYDSREVTSEAIKGQISDFLTQVVM
ncbi:MAG: 2-hydroxyacyl-CoA dehydratase [Candidatus Lokiarchaeota archaeon]|nr:2-hydroxyacyl-CoA dehydratase [Candidatus Lokiarchaeota archaeon]